MSAALDPYQTRVQAILNGLGISADLLKGRTLTLHRQPMQLVDVPPPVGNATTPACAYQLTPAACTAWLALREAARAQGIALALVSAFRSVERQRDIIAGKLAQGQSLAEILSSVAPPGYSEHHSGRAVDIATTEAGALEEVFETTPSYAWLRQHAWAFGFEMSYPRNNFQGFVFEPWHWCYREPPTTGGAVSTSSMAAVSASMPPA